MTTQLSTIQFNNQSLVTFEQNGTYYTAMKPICENIGLAWNAQLLRIKRDEVLSKGMIVMITPTNGGEQEMVCLPIQYLNGWLFGIDTNRVKPEIRETLIKYKKECYQALFDYWFKGKAERIQTTVDERTGLRDAVNMLVSKKGLIYSDAYNLVHQYMNVKSIEDIAKDDLPKAVAYCHKLVLEGELIIEQPKAENFSLTANDVVELAWCLFSAKQQNDLLQMLVKPLDEIKSGYSSEVYTFASEYRHCWQLSFPILDKLVALIDKSTSDTNYERIVMHFKKIRDDLNKPALMFRTR
ncbi:phage antirepressor N-terminal domain-containing protein [Gallibacterium salpingitidis]|uniref:phage antirepressor N-terminal domain-containing protein n=1 Tax=Gallibacterium salpingitidis TaxID=505341 RepID=UPI0008265D11|nr:phage antirepressor N-terminal domain-containing protein [Gallibacterium salpingitidis]